MDIFDAAEKITEAAQAMGYGARTHVAETGSVYLDFARDRADGGLDELTVRVSTHGECYPPAAGVRQISVDPDGMTVDQAADCLRDPSRVTPEAPAAHAPAITHYSCQGGSQTWLPTRHPCVSYDSDAQNVRGATDPYLIQARALRARPQILEDTPPGAAVRWFSARGSQAVIAQMHEGRFPWNPDIPPEIFVIYSETSKTVVPKAVGVALYGKPSIGIDRKQQISKWGDSTLRAEVVTAVQHALNPFMRSALAGELSPQDFYHAAWYNGIRIFNKYAEHKNIVTHGKQYADGLSWFKTLMAKLRRELGIPSPFDVWGKKIAVARANGRRGGRRQTIPWNKYDARILAGENVAALADEIGCSRQMVYNRKFQLKKIT